MQLFCEDEVSHANLRVSFNERTYFSILIKLFFSSVHS